MLLHKVLLVLHIAAGTLAMALFWLPMLAKKGSPWHRRAGHWFVAVMHGLAGSGIVMAVLVLCDPQLKADQRLPNQSLAEFELQVRIFWSFLLLLSLLALSNVRQGMRVLQVGLTRQGLGSVFHSGLLVVTFGFALYTLQLCIRHHFVLGQVFAVVALLTSSGALRYVYKAHVTAAERMQQHIGNMLGCGIAVYTAFFALGGRRFLDLSPQAQFVSWILPSVIGVVAIGLYNWQWQRKLAKTARPA